MASTNDDKTIVDFSLLTPTQKQERINILVTQFLSLSSDDQQRLLQMLKHLDPSDTTRAIIDKMIK